MLTPEQIREIRTKAGFSPDLPDTSPDAQAGEARVQDFYKEIGGAPEVEKGKVTKVAEKIGSFTGGTKIAQGLGQKLAMGKTSKALEQADNESMKIQGELIKRIKEKKAKGQDTKRLEAALTELGFDLSMRAANREDLLNPEKLTGKQVLGDALQLGTTAVGGKAASKITKAVGKVPIKNVGIVKGAARGALQGAAAGLPLGALEGAAQGLKNDQDIGGVAKSALKGAGFGAAGGAVIGGTVGSFSGKMNANKLKKENLHLEAITPQIDDLPASEFREALRKGKIVEKSATEPARYVLSQKEIETANKYKHLLTGKDPVVNINKVMSEVAKKDTEVGNFLRKNNGIFNTGELKNNLMQRLKDVDDITISEDRIAKVKNELVENFIKSLKKNDMETLWKARKEFDKFSKAFQGTPTFKKEMAREFRNAIQQFISERTPDDVYKGYMDEMSELLNLAEDNLTLKAVNERKLSALRLWAKNNPGKTKLLWGALGTVGLGLGAKVVDAAVE